MSSNGNTEVHQTTFRFKIISRSNNSMTGHFLTSNNSMVSAHAHNYDAPGALCYILAIVFMYSFSILMMIGSFVKKSPKDSAIITYMKDAERLDKLQLKQDKFRTKLQMHQKKVHRILGPDRAEVLNPTEEVPSPPICQDPVFDWDVTSQDWEDRRQSGSSVGTTIVCADDLHSVDLPFFRVSKQPFEENGFLSAPNSPTVHQKSLPGLPTESSVNNGENQDDKSHTAFPLLVDPPSMVRSNSADFYCKSKKHHVINMDIPEVRIHECD